MARSAPRAEFEAYVAQYDRLAEAIRREVDWLLNDFDSTRWTILCDTEFTIDWAVILDNGSLLTDPQNARLWTDLRSWLILQTEADVTGGLTFSPRSLRNHLQRAIYCIDYFLLRSSSLGLAEHGLSAITANDLKGMVATLGRSRSLVTSIYDWPERLSSYLRRAISEADPTQVESRLAALPLLAGPVPDGEEFLTSLSFDEVVKARAALWDAGLYSAGGGSEDSGFQFVPVQSRLAGAVYPNTLWGARARLPRVPELGLAPGRRFITEYPRARIAGEQDGRMSAQRLGRYVSTISSLALVDSVPDSALGCGALTGFAKSLDLKACGRFRTLPHTVAFFAIRRSIEFVLEYGDSIVDSFLSLSAAAQAAGQSIATYSAANGVAPHLAPATQELGVKSWRIDPPAVCRTREVLGKAAFYAALRENVGLYECLRVLYGAIQLMVGSLMAQRCGALIGLVATKCIDPVGPQLVFLNGKSGHSGFNQREKRPIPPVAVKAIQMLERLQAGLIEQGVIREFSPVFATPAMVGEARLTSLSKRQFGESLDYFCDWAQMPLDRDGRRYYIRQHQLRRFFAMLFFWGGGFGGLETLRWFLGHTDAEHLWNYITESTPGATIRSVAAQWACYSVLHTTPESTLLAAELSTHFGTRNFSVVDEDILQDYIEGMIEDGRLTVEPQFLDGGTRYRIAILLRPDFREAA